MQTKPLKFTVQAVLVDEDDAGDPVALVTLQPVEIVGRAGAVAALEQHLAAIDQLCADRTRQHQEGGEQNDAHEA